MTWSHLRELHRLGHTVASHTHTHPMLTACRNAALRKELNASRQILEDQLGIEVSSISVPGGRVDARVLLACCEAGYRRVYTSRAGEYRAADATTPEVIGRYIVRRAASDRTLASYLAGDLGTLRRLRFEANAKGFAKLLMGDSLYALAWRKAVRSRRSEPTRSRITAGYAHQSLRSSRRLNRNCLGSNRCG